MSRSYAPIYTSIWNDPDFRSLSVEAQRLYLLIVSQPNINYAGVIPFTFQRWAHMATDSTPGSITRTFDELRAARFVLLDPTTEEVFVRSFVKHNRVLDQPQLRKAMRRSYDEILSAGIRRALFDELPEEASEGLERPDDPPCPEPEPDEEPACEEAAGSLPEPSGLGSTSEVGPKPLTPNPEPASSSSPSDSLGPPPGSDDDEELVETRACWAYAERKYDQQLAEGQRIGHRENWLSATARGALRDVRRYLELHPHDSPERVASELLPDASPPTNGTPPPPAAQPPDYEPPDTGPDWDTGRAELERIRADREALRAGGTK